MRLSTGVYGVHQANGDFIFYTDSSDYRKMVRTSNSGAFIEAGYLPLLATDWLDSTRWTYSNWYRVVNFIKGRDHSRYFLLLCILYEYIIPTPVFRMVKTMYSRKNPGFVESSLKELTPLPCIAGLRVRKETN